MIDISIVIPVMNEEGSLRELHERLSKVLSGTGRPYEILFVDDGSTDDSGEILDGLAQDDDRVGVIHFRCNFGKAAALDAGFRQSRGAIIFTMDADLQDEPAEIPRFLAEMEKGYDLVSGWKMVRHDPLHKTLPSRLFNFVVARVSGLRLRDLNCGFKAYRSRVLKDLNLYGELHRFIPVLVSSRGYRVGEIPVQHHPRRTGKSKYGAARLTKGFFDLLTVLLTTKYLSRPLHLFGAAGLVASALGSVILMYLTVLWFLDAGPIGTRPLLFLGLLLIMVGFQLISTGLLGELICRNQSRHEQHYEIRETREPRTEH
jgi:glycosyltransferase involved in cell wall biosynthesis